MFRPKYIDAVRALAGGITGVGGKSDGPIEKIYYPDSFKPPSEDVIQAKLKELQDAYDNDHSRKREAEYPSIADQLDEIYHNGIDSWKAVIKKTKDKYPKG